jgi:hypothetical protein
VHRSRLMHCRNAANPYVQCDSGDWKRSYDDRWTEVAGQPPHPTVAAPALVVDSTAHVP